VELPAFTVAVFDDRATSVQLKREYQEALDDKDRRMFNWPVRSKESGTTPALRNSSKAVSQSAL
jgi:hypothetical protein